MQNQTCLNSAERVGLRPKGNVPTLRFPEFTDEWISCKVGDYGKIITGSTPPTSDNTNYADGTHLWASPVDLGQTKYVIDTQTKLSSIGFGKTRKLPAGSVLVTCIGSTIGKTGMAATEMSTNQQINSIVVNAQNDKHFVYYALQSRFPRYLTSVAVQAVPIMSKSSFEKLQNYRTTLEEQKKIGALLNLIDERISTQIRIIDKLKSLMQGLNNELMDNPKWKKVYVGDFMEFFPTNSLSWEDLNYDNGQVRNLHYGLIHSGLPTLVDCQKESLPYIQDSSLPKQYTDSKDGDVAFADASEDTAEVGKVVELTNIGNQKIVCGLHTIHGRDFKGITVKGFKGFAFNSKYFHNQLRRIAQGSKVYSINTDNVKSCYLYIPSIAEQQKIVGLLRSMQDKIDVAEQELHQYERQKDFLLQRMFV